MHSAAEIELSKFHDQQARLLAALDQAHDSYYREETFGGPSLYFHLKSLEAGRAQNFFKGDTSALKIVDNLVIGFSKL